jgi:sporulation protein YlmC with PRC-barrel domain
MMKQLLMATAASGLMLSTALAQNPAPPATPPAASPPAATKGLESTPPAAAGKDMSKPAAAASAGQQIISSQTPDQMLASKFSGTDVVGADDKKIGDVSDVLFDKDGKILAYVVSIGGFLGIGSKDVALAPSAFELVKGSQGASDKLRISMSQEQLKQMASFEPYQPPRPTTTGTAPSGTSPRPSPTR